MIPQRKETRYRVLQLQNASSENVFIAETDHGRGLFAAREFQRGEQVGWMEGQIITDESYSSDYCVDLGNGIGLEPQAPFRFLNHSCEPNCELYIVDTDDYGTPLAAPRVTVDTIRSISPGEELAIDYGWPADQAIPCGCGADECRGWVVAEQELHMLPKKSRRAAI